MKETALLGAEVIEEGKDTRISRSFAAQQLSDMGSVRLGLVDFASLLFFGPLNLRF